MLLWNRALQSSYQPRGDTDFGLLVLQFIQVRARHDALHEHLCALFGGVDHSHACLASVDAHRLDAGEMLAMRVGDLEGDIAALALGKTHKPGARRRRNIPQFQ